MTELQTLTEEEATWLRLLIQAMKMNKQILQQEVQNLMSVVEYLKNTAVKYVNEFWDRLKLDLNLFSTWWVYWLKSFISVCKQC